MRAVWTSEMLTRNDFTRNPISLNDLLSNRYRGPIIPPSNEEVAAKFWRWLDREEEVLAQ